MIIWSLMATWWTNSNRLTQALLLLHQQLQPMVMRSSSMMIHIGTQKKIQRHLSQIQVRYLPEMMTGRLPALKMPCEVLKRQTQHLAQWLQNVLQWLGLNSFIFTKDNSICPSRWATCMGWTGCPYSVFCICIHMSKPQMKEIVPELHMKALIMQRRRAMRTTLAKCSRDVHDPLVCTVQSYFRQTK